MATYTLRVDKRIQETEDTVSLYFRKELTQFQDLETNYVDLDY